MYSLKVEWLHFWDWRMRNWRRWLWSRCSDCGRIERMLGWWLPGHNYCIPF
jgi:hypothetical protein